MPCQGPARGRKFGPKDSEYSYEEGSVINSFFRRGNLLKSKGDFARLGLTPRAVGVHGWTLDPTGTNSTKPKERETQVLKD